MLYDPPHRLCSRKDVYPSLFGAFLPIGSVGDLMLDKKFFINNYQIKINSKSLGLFDYILKYEDDDVKYD